MKKYYCWIAVCVFWLCASISHAQVPNQRENLTGVTGVYVYIDSLPAVVTDATSITKEKIQADVESALRQSGITVNTIEEYHSDAKIGLLNVNVSAFKKAEQEFYSYLVTTDIMTAVKMLHSDKIGAAVIWTKASYGAVGVGSVSSLRDTCKDQISLFNKDYLAANTKTKPTNPPDK